MKLYVFDGSPDEIAKVYQSLGVADLGSVAPAPLPTPGREAAVPSGDGLDKFVTADFALEAITRLKLSKPMKSVLKKLHVKYPEWVPTKGLLEASGYTSSQFAGLMGAFGRRLAHTKNFDVDAHFFDYRWNDQTDSWEYRLPESVHAALTNSGLV